MVMFSRGLKRMLAVELTPCDSKLGAVVLKLRTEQLAGVQTGVSGSCSSRSSPGWRHLSKANAG